MRAECVAARSPREPEFTYYDRYPLTDNDEAATDTVRRAFDAYFGEQSCDLDAVPASEDFSIIPDELGATLDRGAEAIVVAASAWLSTYS